MTEQEIIRILSQDRSVGTEAFRDELLARCLEVLDSESVYEVSDDELELLAAAGDPTTTCPQAFNGENKTIDV